MGLQGQKKKGGDDEGTFSLFITEDLLPGRGGLRVFCGEITVTQGFFLGS